MIGGVRVERPEQAILPVKAARRPEPERAGWHEEKIEMVVVKVHVRTGQSVVVDGLSFPPPHEEIEKTYASINCFLSRPDMRAQPEFSEESACVVVMLDGYSASERADVVMTWGIEAGKICIHNPIHMNYWGMWGGSDKPDVYNLLCELAREGLFDEKER